MSLDKCCQLGNWEFSYPKLPNCTMLTTQLPPGGLRAKKIHAPFEGRNCFGNLRFINFAIEALRKYFMHYISMNVCQTKIATLVLVR